MPGQRRKLNGRAVFRIYWEHTKRYPWLFGIAIVGGIVQQSAHVIGPIFIGQIFDIIGNVIPSDVTWQQIWFPLALAALVSFIGWIGGRLEMWLRGKPISHATPDLIRKAFSNLLGHSFRSEERRVGKECRS